MRRSGIIVVEESLREKGSGARAAGGGFGGRVRQRARAATARRTAPAKRTRYVRGRRASENCRQEKQAENHLRQKLSGEGRRGKAGEVWRVGRRRSGGVATRAGQEQKRTLLTLVLTTGRAMEKWLYVCFDNPGTTTGEQSSCSRVGASEPFVWRTLKKRPASHAAGGERRRRGGGVPQAWWGRRALAPSGPSARPGPRRPPAGPRPR